MPFSLWLAEFLLPLQGQQQLYIAGENGTYVVISWIFTTFTGSTTTIYACNRFGDVLWLAEFLLPLQGQQQHSTKKYIRNHVVISWIFTTFTGSTTTIAKVILIQALLWLAEFLLPLQGQQQLSGRRDYDKSVVISWIFTTFTGSTTTRCSQRIGFTVLWLAEFLLPLQGQQQRGE